MTAFALPVAVIGSGPVGLAAAAHLLERGLEPLVLEAGDEVAAGVSSWGHVRVFSPWRYDVDAAAARLLAPTGWRHPEPEDYPTGDELRRDYLLPLAAALGPRVRTGARVLAVRRRSEAFELDVAGADGAERIAARAVIDASGSVGAPNALGADGEEELADAIAYGVPDVRAQHERYAGRRVLVAGAGHSAMNVLQDLVALRPAPQVVWAVRRNGAAGLYGGGEADALPERGRLGTSVERLVDGGEVRLVTGVAIDALELTADGIVARHRDGELGPFDELVAATGFRPDLAPLRALRLSLDPWVEAPTAIAPLIDPRRHSCGTVPPHGALELAHPDEDGFYIAGMKSYGRAPTFLMLTGYEQVRSIAAALAGDEEAAARVELVLPETGVCSVSAGGSACCGGEAPAVAGAPAAGAGTLPVLTGGGCCGATPAAAGSCCG